MLSHVKFVFMGVTHPVRCEIVSRCESERPTLCNWSLFVVVLFIFFNLCVEEGKSRSACEEKIFRVRGSGAKYGGNYLRLHLKGLSLESILIYAAANCLN